MSREPHKQKQENDKQTMHRDHPFPIMSAKLFRAMYIRKRELVQGPFGFFPVSFSGKVENLE